MKSKFLTFILLCLSILLGSYLRLANLENNPNGLYVDEASTGYNAYSILKTGKDEYGKEFPYAFRFLGSYTPPFYTYLTIVPIHFFGLSVTSVRLVSAISGILLIPVVFFFFKSLGLIRWSAYFAAFLVAIAPWDIFYSRVGYETHLALLFYCLGVFLIWLSIKKPVWFILGSCFMALSAMTYQSERLLAPLTIITFLLLYKQTFQSKESRKFLIFGLIAYVLISIPQILIFFTPASTARSFGLFYADTISRQMNELFLPGSLSFLIAFSREFFSQFFTYLSPRNLFFQPDSDLQRSLPELSIFYPWLVIPFFVGLVSIIKKWKEANKFNFVLLILAPIPASLTGDPFSTQRAMSLLIPITFTISVGLGRLLTWHTKLFSILTIIFCVISLLTLYRSFAVLLPNERAKTWGFGFEQLAREIEKRPGENFIIDTSRIKPAYIELAFFLKYPPDKFQQEVEQSIKENYYINTSWSSHYKFSNIETRAINWEEDIYKENILVGDELAISENQAGEHFLEKLFEIRDPIQRIVFIAFKTNPALKCSSQLNKKCST